MLRYALEELPLFLLNIHFVQNLDVMGKSGFVTFSFLKGCATCLDV
jgi:hypothetical protein